jgi:hypothetical protein
LGRNKSKQDGHDRGEELARSPHPRIISVTAR